MGAWFVALKKELQRQMPPTPPPATTTMVVVQRRAGVETAAQVDFLVRDTRDERCVQFSVPVCNTCSALFIHYSSLLLSVSEVSPQLRSLTLNDFFRLLFF
jgi:hypothetical protein